MAHLHFQSHTSQGAHQFGAHPHSVVIGGEIKVSPHIMRHRVDGLWPVALEQEEFGLRADIENPAALLLQPCKCTLKRSPWVAGKFSPIRLVNIAEHPCSAHLKR